MQKKIFSLLVLLMTAVSGAVAQSYEAKVFDVPASWEEDETPISAADLPEDFVQITKDEAKALAVPDGIVVLIYGFEGDKVKVMQFDSGTFDDEEDAADPVQEPRGNFRIIQTLANVKICYTAPAGSSVPVTEVTKNEWQFTMPDYAVVAKIEYDTELELQEENVNTAVLADWDGYEADITLKRKLVAGSWNTLAVPFNVSSTMLGYITAQYGLTVKQLASTSLENEGKTLMLTFTNATEMVAGTPYLVKVTTDFDFSAQALPDVVISKELHPVTTTYIDFIPTLGKTTIEGVDAENILFVAAGNLLKHPNQMPTDMKGFRAYFLLKNLPTEARGFALNLGDESTGIESLTASPMGEGSIYTLDGRRIGKAAQKGVYIQNGKKVIIRSATQGDACQSKK